MKVRMFLEKHKLSPRNALLYLVLDEIAVDRLVPMDMRLIAAKASMDEGDVRSGLTFLYKKNYIGVTTPFGNDRSWVLREDVMVSELKCPRCDGQELNRLYASFWAPVNGQGDDLAANFSDHQSSTELTEKMLCRSCDYAFEEGDDGAYTNG